MKARTETLIDTAHFAGIVFLLVTLLAAFIY